MVNRAAARSSVVPMEEKTNDPSEELASRPVCSLVVAIIMRRNDYLNHVLMHLAGGKSIRMARPQHTCASPEAPCIICTAAICTASIRLLICSSVIARLFMLGRMPGRGPPGIVISLGQNSVLASRSSAQVSSTLWRRGSTSGSRSTTPPPGHYGSCLKVVGFVPHPTLL